MNKSVKKFVILFHLALILFICTITFHAGCKDPYEFEPPEDTLLPPPDPPQLVSPIDNFVFMVEATPIHINIQLEWEGIEQAQLYQLELIIDTLPPNIIDCQANSWSFTIVDTSSLCDYFWRVRASSPTWEWFTDWSEQWHFEADWRPLGPQLRSPSNYATFNVDSLPLVIDFYWSEVSGTEFYELRIIKDTQLIDQQIVTDTLYTVVIEDTNHYTWQVRAGSLRWQNYSYWSEPWFFWVHYH